MSHNWLHIPDCKGQNKIKVVCRVCRWFGLGFLLYWCIGTPLLFKSYRFGHARGLWHYTVTQHNLWATYCLCLVSQT